MWHHFNYERAAEMRRKYIPVETVLKVADLGPEDIIMDVGGGDGFYSLIFSETAKKVIYVDPSESAASLIRSKLESSSGKIEILKEDICQMKLPHGVTKVFFSNSFHDISCRSQVVERFSRESNGKVEFVLVEFKKDADIGPPAHIKLGIEDLNSIFSEHNYSHIDGEVLEKHYVSRYKHD